jgi:hypothetical protein
MSTLVEYLVRTSDQTFEEMMFNEVDGLILTYVASFLHYTNIKKQGSVIFSALKDEKGMRQFTSRPAHPNNQKLLKTLSQSNRYCEVEIFYPLEVIKPKEKEKFRAITYQLPNAMRVVAFKGSDSSLLSWEENSAAGNASAGNQVLTKKLGRNDPCHCGSGKKYKKCCLDKDQKMNAR